MNLIKKLSSLVTFSHTIFALPFAFLGFFIGVRVNNFEFSLKLLILMILCMVFARNAAMSFNRYIDRFIDKKNERTKNREIPSGIIKPKNALFFCIANAVLFVLTTFFINKLVFYLSPIALFIVLFYSYTKRFTSFSHFVLGLGLAIAPIGAYLAVTESFDLIPLILSLVVLLWVSGFDILYSIQDIEFDKENKLFSIPSKIGIKNSLILSTILHILSVFLIFLVGILGSYNIWYFIGCILYTGFIVYQHIIVKPNDLSKLNKAFFFSNGLASVTFSIFSIIGVLLS